MVSLPVSGTVANVRRRAGRRRLSVARALASLCEVCGGPVAGGAVIYGPLEYCSIDCAHSTHHRFVAGNYLG